MAKVKVYNMLGAEVGQMNLPDSIFGADYNEALIHEVVVAYNANQRQGTKSALTRSEVRGHAKKPWRQKGTGRARQGSKKGPQWTGGGVVFAPKPRDYSFKMNKKEKRLALKSALTSRVQENKLIVVEELKFDEIKTKNFKAVMDNLKVNKALVVLGEKNDNTVLSARNIPGVDTTYVGAINTYEVLNHTKCIIVKDAVSKLEEVYA